MQHRRPSSNRAARQNSDPNTVLNAKWGREVIALGYTAVPDILLMRMAALGLKPAELVLVLQLLRYWWSADQLPFPSKRTLAGAIGCSEKNVQKVIARLVATGLVLRIERRCAADRNQSNVYDLRPLVERLKKLAAVEAAERGRIGAAGAGPESGLIPAYPAPFRPSRPAVEPI